MSNVGRPIDKKAVEQVKQFRAKGLTFRQISRIMQKDIKSIWRWYLVGEDKIVDKLS